jgi:hypothetical protein
VVVLGIALAACGGSQAALFVAEFGGPDRLLTNEYGQYNPHASGLVRSPQWFVTSGSLFIRSEAATNGHLDRITPNAHSSNGTNSAVFRAYTKQRFHPDYGVIFELRVGTPRHGEGLHNPWDGVHLMLNAQSAQAAYYVSLYRRDGQAVIKKKTPPGPVAGGTYQALSKYVPDRIRPGRWTQVRVDVRRSNTGAITIDLYEAGMLLATATDDRTISDSPPLTAGRLGIRADETIFSVKDLTVDRI